MKHIEERDFESIKAVEPDIEIVVRVGEFETAVFGLFQNKLDVWDVVVGIDDAENRQGVMDALAIARGAMADANFQEVRTASGTGGGILGDQT